MAKKPLTEQDIADVRLALGKRIADLRHVSNLSQTEASARAGLNRRNWIRIEKGETTPRLESLLQIQCMFGLDTLDALFGPTTGDLLKIRSRVDR
jgi:transcriptional regulator with XRE-family HTH domain